VSIKNPNRFVTGLSDISYVQQVNIKEIPRFPGQINVTKPDCPPIIIQQSITTEETFVPDTFTPENMSDNVSDDEIG
jgi:hypothetical protein